jgi:hypothetical protein
MRHRSLTHTPELVERVVGRVNHQLSMLAARSERRPSLSLSMYSFSVSFVFLLFVQIERSRELRISAA